MLRRRRTSHRRPRILHSARIHRLRHQKIPPRAAGIDEDVDQQVQDKPAEAWPRSEQNDEDDDCHDQQPVDRVLTGLAVDPERRALLPLGGVGGQHRDDVVDAARDAVTVVAGLEARRHGVGNDHFRECVGQRAFQAIADFDSDALFVGRNQQQDAVVLRLFAELPGPEQLVGVRLDLLSLEGGYGRDDKLDA